MTPLGLYLATFAVCFLTGLLPVGNTEAYLLSVSAFSLPASALPLTLAGALGQMTAKSLVYCSGRGLLRLPFRRYRARIDSVQARLDANRGRAGAFMFVSALAAMPPFYVVSLVAGTLRQRFAHFFAAGLAGTFLRLGAFVLLPQAVRLWT